MICEWAGDSYALPMGAWRKGMGTEADQQNADTGRIDGCVPGRGLA